MALAPGLLLAIILPLIVIVIAVWGGMRYLRQREEVVKGAVATGQADALRYHVPTGQDPAAIMAALHNAGFEATPETAGVTQDLLIVTNNGRNADRAAVRRIIAHDADLNLEGDPSPTQSVRFADE